MKINTQRMMQIAGSLGLASIIAWFAWQQAERTAVILQALGPVPLNAHKDFTIELSNSDPIAHQLVSVKPSCTCLTIVQKPALLPANGKALVQVRFTPEKPGPTTADVNIEWKDLPTGLPQKTWRISAEVIPPPEAFPSADALSQTREFIRDGTIASAASSISGSIPLILDVRSDSDYQRASVPGAMHVPMAALSTLPASLREQPALLMDRGIGLPATTHLVKQLRSNGWPQLRIIEGGFLAWQANGGRITAAPPSSSRAITADEARQCCTRPGWIVVTPISLASNWHVKELFADILTFNPKTKPAEIAASLANELKQRRPGDGATTTALHILVATESGEQADLIADALQPQAVAMPVFVLAGGLRSYIDHLQNLRPTEEHRWTTLADYRGVLADLRQRQRLVSACSSCRR